MSIKSTKSDVSSVVTSDKLYRFDLDSFDESHTLPKTGSKQSGITLFQKPCVSSTTNKPEFTSSAQVWIKVKHNGVSRLLALHQEEFSIVLQKAFQLAPSNEIVGLLAHAQKFGQNCTDDIPPAILSISSLELGYHPYDLLPRVFYQPNVAEENSLNREQICRIEFELLLQPSQEKPMGQLSQSTRHSRVHPPSFHKFEANNEVGYETDDEFYEETVSIKKDLRVAKTHTDWLVEYVYNLVKSKQLSILQGETILENRLDLIVAKSFVVARWIQDESYFINILASMADEMMRQDIGFVEIDTEPIRYSELEQLLVVAEILAENDKISSDEYILLVKSILDKSVWIKKIYFEYHNYHRNQCDREKAQFVNNTSATEYIYSALCELAHLLFDAHDSFSQTSEQKENKSSYFDLSLKQVLLHGVESLVTKKLLSRSDFLVLLELFENDDELLLSSCGLFRRTRSSADLEAHILNRLHLYYGASDAESASTSCTGSYSKDDDSLVLVQDEKASSISQTLSSAEKKSDSSSENLAFPLVNNDYNDMTGVINGIALLLDQHRISKDAAAALVTSFAMGKNPLLNEIKERFNQNKDVDSFKKLLEYLVTENSCTENNKLTNIFGSNYHRNHVSSKISNQSIISDIDRNESEEDITPVHENKSNQIAHGFKLGKDNSINEKFGNKFGYDISKIMKVMVENDWITKEELNLCLNAISSCRNRFDNSEDLPDGQHDVLSQVPKIEAGNDARVEDDSLKLNKPSSTEQALTAYESFLNELYMLDVFGEIEASALKVAVARKDPALFEAIETYRVDRNGDNLRKKLSAVIEAVIESMDAFGMTPLEN